jgi:hypothetical protein
MQRCETAIFGILSPVRLPFRHTGNSETIALSNIEQPNQSAAIDKQPPE